MGKSARWYPGIRFSKLFPFNLLPATAQAAVVDPINGLAHVSAECDYSALPCTRSGGIYSRGEEYGDPFIPRPGTGTTDGTEEAAGETVSRVLDPGRVRVARDILTEYGEEVALVPTNAVELASVRYDSARYDDSGILIPRLSYQKPFELIADEAAALRVPPITPIAALPPQVESGALCGAFHGPVRSYNETDVKADLQGEFEFTVGVGAISGGGVTAEGRVWLECAWKTRPVGISRPAPRCSPGGECEDEESIRVSVEYSLTGRLFIQFSTAIQAGVYKTGNRNKVDFRVHLVDSWSVECKKEDDDRVLHMPEIPPLPAPSAP